LSRPLGEYLRVFHYLLYVAIAHQSEVGALRSKVDHVGDVATAGMVGYQVHRALQVYDLVASGLEGQVYAVL